MTYWNKIKVVNCFGEGKRDKMILNILLLFLLFEGGSLPAEKEKFIVIW